MFKTTIKGRSALNDRLRRLAPEAEKQARLAKLNVAEEAAELIENAAPLGDTGDYRASIKGEYQASNPDKKPVNGIKSSDPDATGVYADYIWRWLEFGTKPHNVAKGGGTVAGQRQLAEGGGIQNPGTAAQPHVFPTWRAYKPKAVRKVRDAINRAVRESRKR
jgi:hypothetical protein